MTTKYKPIHLKKHTEYTKDSYIGQECPNYYVVVTQHRNSVTYDRSNFEVAKQRLRYKEDSNQVIVFRASHWACGWVEYLLVKDTCFKKLEIADKIKEDLKNHLILDESHFSELEYTEGIEYFNNYGKTEILENVTGQLKSILGTENYLKVGESQELQDLALEQFENNNYSSYPQMSLDDVKNLVKELTNITI